MQLMDSLVGDQDLTTCFELIAINPQLVIDGGELTPLVDMFHQVVLLSIGPTAIAHPLVLFFDNLTWRCVISHGDIRHFFPILLVFRQHHFLTFNRSLKII